MVDLRQKCNGLQQLCAADQFRPPHPLGSAPHKSIPAKQLALADAYRDATAVIDALGWDPDLSVRQSSVEVPITAGHIQQLHIRRCDLLDTNLDLLDDIGADNHTNALIMVDIHTNRHSVEALNIVFDAYSDTITT